MGLVARASLLSCTQTSLVAAEEIPSSRLGAAWEAGSWVAAEKVDSSKEGMDRCFPV